MSELWDRGGSLLHSKPLSWNDYNLQQHGGNGYSFEMIHRVLVETILIRSDNGTYGNETLPGINWEQFPQGVMSLIVGLISLVWLSFSMRGIFKNQISLQRKLFFMIFCSCVIRTGRYYLNFMSSPFQFNH